ncbi:MAG: hypothetical protein KDN22_19195 [Verrucomicrobiae bacterium]|nr:hypothetical protein [Verrucomicrobiae bacterium]
METLPNDVAPAVREIRENNSGVRPDFRIPGTAVGSDERPEIGSQLDRLPHSKARNGHGERRRGESGIGHASWDYDSVTATVVRFAPPRWVGQSALEEA